MGCRAGPWVETHGYPYAFATRGYRTRPPHHFVDKTLETRSLA